MIKHILLLACAVTLARSLEGQTIDFETLPDGTPTADEQFISTEYAAPPFGVSFTIVDGAGQFVAFPKIAKVGPPITAFQGCPGPDEPLPGQGVGASFLTDDSDVGFLGNLLVTYTNPVGEASGVILDVDNRGPFVPGGLVLPEEWTITARDMSGATLQQVVITAPSGPDNACVAGIGQGPGDGLAISWTVQSTSDDIASILLEYTGTAGGVGLAFDNFSTSCAGPASSVIRNGSGLNRVGFAEVTSAIIGLDWETTIQLETLDDDLSVMLIGLGGPVQGVFLDGFLNGELLCRPPFAIDIGRGSHSFSIPNDCDLIGSTFCAQGANFYPDGRYVVLANAIDATIGTF